jgi:hypothetical protein
MNLILLVFAFVLCVIASFTHRWAAQPGWWIPHPGWLGVACWILSNLIGSAGVLR